MGVEMSKRHGEKFLRLYRRIPIMHTTKEKAPLLGHVEWKYIKRSEFVIFDIFLNSLR
jgi:hypothetical protein